MPTFDTPTPPSLRIRLEAGDLVVTATDRSDTTVRVEPHKNRDIDRQVAEQTRVEQLDGEIIVETPDRKRMSSSGAVKIFVEAPTGSRLTAASASADIRVTGELGDTEVETASGDVRLEVVERLAAKTASGSVVCRTVRGEAGVNTASGDATVHSVEGDAGINTASGDIRVTDVGGKTSLNTASGDVELDRAGDSVDANAASGDIRIRSVRQGSTSVNTASGDVVIGVAGGTAAWLELNSLSGDVGSQLDPTDSPTDDGPTVEIRVQTISGDIRIVRAG